MKKLSLYIFLGLLWCNVGFAEEIFFSSEDFVIIKYKNYNVGTRVAVGADGYNTYSNQANVKIPYTAQNYCKNLGNKNTYLLGTKTSELWGDAYVDWHLTKFVIWGHYVLIRYFCANNADEAVNNLKKYVEFKKIGKVKFYPVLVYNLSEYPPEIRPNLSYLIQHENLIWATNDKKYLASLEEKKKKKEPKTVAKKSKFVSKEKQYEHTCVKALGLRKGSKRYMECALKIMEMELELTKLNAEKEVALAQAETAMAKQQTAKVAELNAMANAKSQKFKENVGNLLLGLLVLGEINSASQQANSFKKVFTCSSTGFATGTQYSVNCY